MPFFLGKVTGSFFLDKDHSVPALESARRREKMSPDYTKDRKEKNAPRYFANASTSLSAFFSSSWSREAIACHSQRNACIINSLLGEGNAVLRELGEGVAEAR